MREVGLFLVTCLCLVLAACGGSKHKTPASTSTGGDEDGGADVVCTDEDGDGYGLHCELGPDCDDHDPDVTDECRRCGGVAKDCPCKPGTRAVTCTPATLHVAGGTLVCKEGNRYCRSGYWSDCETIGGYVFKPDP
jgi:hypothetical protein